VARTLRFLDRLPVSKLAGVGPKLEERLVMLGVESVLDLLQHYPRRYLDRTKRAEIADLRLGEEATVFAEVRKITGRRTRNRRSLVEAVFFDGRSYLTVTFFNQPWRERQLPVGTEAALFGKLEAFRGRRKMTNPVVDVVGQSGDDKTGVIVPIYPQSEKADISTWQIQKLVAEALVRAGDFADPLASDVLDANRLVARTAAYRGIHRPESDEDWRSATRRLIFDEFLRMQLGMVARKRAIERDSAGIAHEIDGPLVGAFWDQLPFELTSAQHAAIDEIATDLARPRPMHRLLQGDVGSGKTVVAVSALLMAVQGGYQGALMAPTEVLAEQHHLGVRSLLEGLTVPDPSRLTGDRPVRLELLTNRTTATDRRELAAGLGDGTIDLVVGTHALIYEGVEFSNLGLAVIDEQHRFGVEQRALLRAKADDDRHPDVLVMTATPIPRTAAMLVYGDLDKSELREMPAGRQPVETRVLGAGPLERASAYERLREQVAAGHQAFVVCPLVEGSEKIEARAATEEFERLQREDLADLRLGLLHGQLPSKDKEAVMAAFRDGQLDVLVATTVIEVGVDIPNATVMIVEDADQIGRAHV